MTISTPYPPTPQVVLYEDTFLGKLTQAGRVDASAQTNVTLTLSNPTVVIEGTSTPGYVVFLNETVVSPNRKSPFAVVVDPQGNPSPAVASIGYRMDLKDLTRQKVLWPTTPPGPKKP